VYICLETRLTPGLHGLFRGDEKLYFQVSAAFAAKMLYLPSEAALQGFVEKLRAEVIYISLG
jgi:hypothetical protein